MLSKSDEVGTGSGSGSIGFGVGGSVSWTFGEFSKDSGFGGAWVLEVIVLDLQNSDLCEVFTLVSGLVGLLTVLEVREYLESINYLAFFNELTLIFSLFMGARNAWDLLLELDFKALASEEII